MLRARGLKCVLAICALAAIAGGCAKQPPPIVRVDGTVTVNNEPLPFAAVSFVPQLGDWGAEVNSYGETDEIGRFSLTCVYNQQPGAVVGKHLVGVRERPNPEAVSQDPIVAKRGSDRVARLANRPIPPGPGAGGTIEIEVTQGRTSYDIRLTRPGK